MKTQITVETTPNQEMIIGLGVSGELRKALQFEVREYFEGILEAELFELGLKAKRVVSAAADPAEVARIEV